MSDRETLADVLGHWREEAERGRHVEPDKLIESHPDLATDLHRNFEAQSVLDHFFADADARPVEPPAVLGDYRLGREIGRGGMGVVYEAEQISMERCVALKVLFPTIATTVTTRKRFENEARVTGRLHHTNIVMVHAMGQQHGCLYFAMELVRGHPLDEVIAHRSATEHGDPGRVSIEGTVASIGGRKGYERIAKLFAGVADALQIAHANGVIHRDVKPSNLILNDDGLLKLTDFGLARLVGDRLAVTRTGDIIGTPLYMSPEQIKGVPDEIDPRTDIYSLGATLYELLALTRPHEAADVASICSQILTHEPVDVRQHDPSIPKDLGTIVHKAMEKDRTDRYASAGDMARDLRAFAEGRSIQASPIGRVARTWRRVKRHRVRSALIASTVLLAIVGITLGLALHRDARSLERIEYDRLLLRASGTASFAPVIDSGRHQVTHGARPPGLDASLELYGQAVRLSPDRTEAFLLRALIPHRSPAEQFADLAAASQRGLDERTEHLARAILLRLSRRHESADEQERRARDLPERDSIDGYLEGCAHMLRREFKEAVQALTRAIDMNAESSAVHHLARHTRALAHERAGATASAIEDYSSLAKAGWSDPGVPIRMASLWRILGQEEQAEQIVQQAMTRDMREQEWLIMWATAHKSNQADWRARISLAAYERFANSVQTISWRAVQLAREGDAERAVDLANTAAAMAPDSLDVQLTAATAFVLLKKWEAAKNILEKLLKLDLPTAGEVHNMLAIVYQHLGRGDAFLDQLRKAVEADPYEPLWYSNVALTLSVSGPEHVEEAMSWVSRGLEVDDRCASLHRVGGRIYRLLGDVPAALEAFQRACALEEDPRSYQFLGGALEASGRLEDARDALVKAANLAIEDREPRMARQLAITVSAAAWYLLICTDTTLRDPEGAQTYSLAAIEMDPSQAGFWNTLGWSRLRLGQEPRACLEAFQKSCELRLEGPDGWDYCGMAIAYHRTGDVERAKDALQKADEWASANPTRSASSPFKEFQGEARTALGVSADSK